jgi:ribosome-binding factor A
MSFKKARLEEIVREYAAQWFARESNRKSMITVTRVESNEKGNMVTVYITAFPESQEEAALDFARRNLSEFRAFVRYESRIMKTPFFAFEIDKGEKARQKIDAAL